MKVIILHPTEELLLVNYQKELIKALYSDNRVIFLFSPLWLDLPEKDVSSENLKEFSKTIRQITFGEIVFDSSKISLSVKIETSGGAFSSKLSLVSIIKGADFSEEDKNSAAKIKQPVRQLKVFRLGMVQEEGPHAKSISKSVWCKIK